MSQTSVNPYIHGLEHSVILPLVLLLNFGIFQYLVLLFHNKVYRQPYVCLLLLASALSVATIVPFSTQPPETLGIMNDVSESCLALMLLVQTAFALKNAEAVETIDQTPGSPKVSSSEGGRWRLQKHKYPDNRRRRVYLSALKGMHVAADILILLDCGFVVFGTIAIFKPHILDDFGGADDLSNGLEITTLAYTLLYRFLALALSKGGFRAMLREDGLELVAHIGFALHEYPFLIAENTTGLSWELLQMAFMRLMLVPCVWMTIGEHHFRHPSHSQLKRLSAPALQELIQRASSVAETKSLSRTGTLTNVNPADTGSSGNGVNHLDQSNQEPKDGLEPPQKANELEDKLRM